MSFLRVRGATPGDPKHEFDAPADVVNANPDLYEVLDAEPVSQPRPVEYVDEAPPARSGKKPGGPTKENAHDR